MAATWDALQPVVEADADGQQFMPALAYAAGRLQLIWYDVRFDESGLTDTALINEKEALDQPQPFKIRRTIDLLGAQASLPSSAWPPVFQPYGVAQPDYNEVVQRRPASARAAGVAVR